MRRIVDTECNVVMLDLGNTIQCMQITKCGCTVLVLQSHEYVVVVDKNIKRDKNEPFVKLAKVFNRPNQAYKEWLRVIGKMCKKDCTSKYFGFPDVHDHLKNGGVPKWARPIVLDIARTAVDNAY